MTSASQGQSESVKLSATFKLLKPSFFFLTEALLFIDMFGLGYVLGDHGHFWNLQKQDQFVFMLGFIYQRCFSMYLMVKIKR